MKSRSLIIIAVIFVIAGAALSLTGIALGATGSVIWKNGIHFVNNSELKTFKETGLSSISSLDFSTVSADIILEEGESWGFEITTYEDDLEWSVKNGTLSIGVEQRNKLLSLNFSFTLKEHILRITYPRSAAKTVLENLTINTVSGDVSVPPNAGITVSGNLGVHTTSGDIRINGIKAGKAQITTVSGEVSIKGSSVTGTVGTTSGDVYVSTLVSGSVETVSGDVYIEKAYPIESYRGSIETVSGDITVESRSLKRGTVFSGKEHELSVETVSGDIVIE